MCQDADAMMAMIAMRVRRDAQTGLTVAALGYRSENSIQTSGEHRYSRMWMSMMSTALCCKLAAGNRAGVEAKHVNADTMDNAWAQE